MTRTRRIPNVLRIHVRVINSALLALHRLPVFLSFGFSHGPTFSNIPNCTDSIWGPSESRPTSLFSLLFPYAASSRVSCIDRRVYTSSFYVSFRLPYAAAGREYYADVTIISNATVFPDILRDAMLIVLINSDLLFNYSRKSTFNLSSMNT